MERLTMRVNGQLALTKSFPQVIDTLDVVASRLELFELTGFTPSDIADLRNFACQRCGKYKTAHEGSCDNCRWRVKT